jgi:hypothetical protein
MPVSAFEKFLPWTGALAGVAWAVQMIAAKTPDDPADPRAVSMISDATGRNYLAGFAMLAGALMLVFFAAAVRRRLRSGEAAESTYSSVAHGGLLVAATAIGLLGTAQIALINAAKTGDPQVTTAIGELALVGWLPALAGLVATFWGLGLGGLRTATLPKWFAFVTLALGVIGVLGPLAIAVYLALPLWLVAASFLLAGRRHPARRAEPATV